LLPFEDEDRKRWFSLNKRKLSVAELTNQNDESDHGIIGLKGKSKRMRESGMGGWVKYYFLSALLLASLT